MQTIAKATAILLLATCIGCATAENEARNKVENPIAATPPEVYDISQVEVVPVAIKQSAPRYPKELRQQWVSGEGVVIFTVLTDGSVSDASIVRATDVRFGEAAVEAVMKWRFRPAKVGGSPVKCRIMVPIEFNLERE